MRTRIFGALVATLIAGFINAQQRKDVTVRIPLDPSGVSDFTYLNRANVPNIDGKAVEFYNATTDRTFIVKMPFTYTGDEFLRAFATARERRGGTSLREIVCGALPPPKGKRLACTQSGDDLIGNGLDRVEGLRTFIETLDRTKGETVIDLSTCEITDANCLVQRTFAIASCRSCNSIVKPDFPTFLDTVADEQLALLMTGAGSLLEFPARCVLNASPTPVKPADIGLGVVPSCTAPDVHASGPGVLGSIGQAQSEKAFAAELSERRFTMARDALRNAAKRREALEFESFGPLREQLEAAFKDAQHEAKSSRDNAVRDAQENRAAYIERAAKLLSSYAADSPVPFPIRPAADDPLETIAQKNVRLLSANMMYVANSVAPAMADAAGSGASDRGINIGDCEGQDKVTCVASAVILPRQYARFSNDTLRHHDTPIITFSIEFFGQSSPPPNGNAYVALSAPSATKIDSLPSKFGIKLGMGGETALDVSDDFIGHTRHTSGTGSTAIEFTGGIVDASVSLRFKKGDFGGPATTRTVSVSQYQAKISGPKKLILQFGQFEFAKPSSGIALAETGEGVRLAYKKLTLSHVIHRESDAIDGTIDREDDDSYVGILELKNLLPTGVPALSGIDISFAYGNNENDETPKDDNLTDDKIPTRAVPYTFITFGSETRFTFARLGDVNASLGVYHSQRNIRPHEGYTPDDLAKGVKNGRGTVGLLTLGWSFTRSASLFEKEAKTKPTYGPSFTVARGTSDKSSTDDRDEGYIGENAGFSQDKIFLSTISVGKDFKEKVGEGLEGKWYAGVQWNDNRWSLLLPIARAFGDERTIASYATIASLHSYWFADKQAGASRSGGLEADIEFQLESPQKVTWTIGGAYFHRSRAVELAGLTRDPWQITAGVSLSLKGP